MANAISFIQVNDAIVLFNHCLFFCILQCPSEILLLRYVLTKSPARASRSPGHVVRSWEAWQSTAGAAHLGINMWLSNTGFISLLPRARMEVRSVGSQKRQACAKTCCFLGARWEASVCVGPRHGEVAPASAKMGVVTSWCALRRPSINKAGEQPSTVEASLLHDMISCFLLTQPLIFLLL